MLSDKIGQALRAFSTHLNIGFRIVSKIDSCLRSNYEAEYNGLAHGFGKFNLEILIPSYVEQMRVTVYGEQYIKIGNCYQHLHESEFASFKGLEFKNSNIALWAEKKCPHLQSRHNVGLVDIDELRSSEDDAIVSKLVNRANNIKMVVFDSLEDSDITAIMNVLIKFDAAESNVFYKLGPSAINKIVSVYASKLPDFSAGMNVPVSNIFLDDNGIIVAGSLSTKTKSQIETLRDETHISLVLISEGEIDAANQEVVIERKIKKILEKKGHGDHIILTTEFWKSNDNEYPTIAKRDIVLSLFAKISGRIKSVPHRWFLFKGSDTALYTLTKGIGIRQFFYCGQYVPGVIHCKCNLGTDEMKSFFIIGGNIGEVDTLTDFIKILSSNLAS